MDLIKLMDNLKMVVKARVSLNSEIYVYLFVLGNSTLFEFLSAIVYLKLFNYPWMLFPKLLIVLKI